MQDYLFVSFFLGHDAGDEARRLLRECDLLEQAASERANRHAWRGNQHTGASLRLPADDERLQRLLTRLRARLIVPFTRVDREYSKQELDAAEWLVLRIATAGLYGGVDYSQSYDSANACSTCGAGAVPRSPLIAELGSMGQKDLDHLVFEGHLVASRRLARAVRNLTGVSVAAVRSRRGVADPRFAWLRITAVLPKMHPSTRGYQTEGLCPTCGRAGHFGNPMEPESVWYDTLPSDTPDFNLTWEYFGDWRQRRHKAQTQSVGGSQGVVVSQRVRQKLLQLKVRRLVWVPVRIATISSVDVRKPRSTRSARNKSF